MSKKKCFSNGCKTGNEYYRDDYNHRKSCDRNENQVCIIDGMIHIPYDSGVCTITVSVLEMARLIVAYNEEVL